MGTNAGEVIKLRELDDRDKTLIANANLCCDECGKGLFQWTGPDEPQCSCTTPTFRNQEVLLRVLQREPAYPIHLAHVPHIQSVSKADVTALHKAEQNYQGSWQKRGGVGAFMMLARKWDRMEAQVQKHGWDIFEAIKHDMRAEGLIDDIRDLRRYLTLVEAKMIADGVTHGEPSKD